MKPLSPARISGRGLRLSSLVKLTEPQFEGQTKTKLGNSEIRGFVDNATNENITAFFEENPQQARIIIEKDCAQPGREKLPERREISPEERAPLTA